MKKKKQRVSVLDSMKNMRNGFLISAKKCVRKKKKKVFFSQINIWRKLEAMEKGTS